MAADSPSASSATDTIGSPSEAIEALPFFGSEEEAGEAPVPRPRRRHRTADQKARRRDAKERHNVQLQLAANKPLSQLVKEEKVKEKASRLMDEAIKEMEEAKKEMKGANEKMAAGAKKLKKAHAMVAPDNLAISYGPLSVEDGVATAADEEGNADS